MCIGHFSINFRVRCFLLLNGLTHQIISKKGSCFEAAGPGNFVHRILLCSINLVGGKLGSFLDSLKKKSKGNTKEPLYGLHLPIFILLIVKAKF